MSNARNIASIAGEDVLNASNEIVPVFACRAWVNFDGTNAFSPNPSTSAIRDSGNVTSITDNGTGDYTINFATAMPDANYCATFGTTKNSSAARRANFATIDVDEGGVGNAPATTSLRVRGFENSSAASDAAPSDPFYFYVAIFR